MKKVKKKSTLKSLSPALIKDSDIIYKALVNFTNEIRLMTMDNLSAVKALGLIDELDALMDYFDDLCNLRDSNSDFLVLINYDDLLQKTTRFREIYFMLYSMSGAMSEAKRLFLSNIDISINNFKIAKEEYSVNSIIERFKKIMASENANLDGDNNL